MARAPGKASPGSPRPGLGFTTEMSYVEGSRVPFFGGGLFMLEFRTVKGLGLGLTLTAAMGLAASPAAAQDPAPPETPSEEPAPPAEAPPPINLTGGPTIDVSTPEPPAPEGRTFHRHEGFYARADVGLGMLLGANVDLPGDEL